MEAQAQEFIKKFKLLECIQCGMCTGGCPVSIKTELNPRRILREVGTFKRVSIPPENQIWSCTTCSTCEKRCPKELSPFSLLIGLRGILIEEGRVPVPLRDALESIFTHGNPWTRARAKRMEWAEGLNLKHISEGADLLYHIGCTPAYDTRVLEVAKALVKCFDAAKVNFGVLGNEENCCGSEVYGMGEVGLFEMLVEDNTKIFEKYGVKQMVTSCPHGYDVFKNNYGDSGFTVQHHTQLLADLVEKGKLELKRKVNKVVTYHDPCFLGKRNGVYEEPRALIESVPGIKFIEFDRSKKRSLCCEGGGGRMWFDVPGERFAEIRVKDAVDLGVDTILTSCPFCLVTINDGVKVVGKEDEIQVMDVAELVAMAL